MSSCLGTLVRNYGITQLLEDPGASLLLENLVREPEVQLLKETCADKCPVAWELLCGFTGLPSCLRIQERHYCWKDLCGNQKSSCLRKLVRINVQLLGNFCADLWDHPVA
jgi:hypothetical protein